MQKVAQRFKEPSSWAGIAVLLSLGTQAFGLPSDTANLVVQVGSGLAGLVAILVPEKK